MNPANWISMLGGLALFLYGMRLMGDGLKKGSSDAFKRAMEKVTNNPLVGFLLGLVVTAVIQSSTATIVPLTMAAFPFISRMVESSLAEVDGGVIEAAQAMGATPMQIIRKVYIPEATPSLISGAAIVATNILGYSAMAGSVGGGGLGAIAINYGYYRFNAEVMVVCIAIMVVLVQAMQLVGTRLSVQLDHRLR